jgi:hypothetical protein
MSGVKQKVCNLCGLDVSDKPRTKDVQGRYFCQSCSAKSAAQTSPPAMLTSKPAPDPTPLPGSRAVAKPAEPPAMVDPIMEKILGEALPAITASKDAPAVQLRATTCNACSAAMSPGATVCLVCGYNAQTGKVIKTKVLAAEKAPKSASGSRPQRISIEVGGWGAFLICSSILGVLFALAMNDIKDDQFVGLFAITYMLMAIVTMVMLVFTPFREGEIGWGIVILLSPFVPFLGIAVLYYLFAVTDRGSLKGMYVACIIGYIMMAIIGFNRREAGLDRDSDRDVSSLVAPAPVHTPDQDFILARSLS